MFERSERLEYTIELGLRHCTWLEISCLEYEWQPRRSILRVEHSSAYEYCTFMAQYIILYYCIGI